jgi:hypothetical protein
MYRGSWRRATGERVYGSAAADVCLQDQGRSKRFIGAVLVVLAEYYLQNILGAVHGVLADVPVISALFHPDRWLLWLGVLFVLIVTFFPQGILGWLRHRRECMMNSVRN